MSMSSLSSDSTGERRAGSAASAAPMQLSRSSRTLSRSTDRKGVASALRRGSRSRSSWPWQPTGTCNSPTRNRALSQLQKPLPRRLLYPEARGFLCLHPRRSCLLRDMRVRCCHPEDRHWFLVHCLYRFTNSWSNV
uniref:ACHT4 n=1 Tax=Arundo donax TaxID=35708 RepID=A0A0A9E443_ARUDO